MVCSECVEHDAEYRADELFTRWCDEHGIPLNDFLDDYEDIIIWMIIHCTDDASVSIDRLDEIDKLRGRLIREGRMH